MSITVANPRGDDVADARITPLDRLSALCDPGSLDVIRSEVRSIAMGDRAVAGDGVIGGAGLVDGRPVFCYAQDASYAGGSLGAAHAETIVRVLELAERARAPVVGFVGSGGARMQEGVAALGGYGRIFRRSVALSGKVPQISIITGLSAGGGAYSPALTDWVDDDREREHVPDRPGRRQGGARRRGDRRRARRPPRPPAQRRLPLRRTDRRRRGRARATAARLPAEPLRLPHFRSRRLSGLARPTQPLPSPPSPAASTTSAR